MVKSQTSPGSFACGRAVETYSVLPGAGTNFRMQIKALAADAVGGAFDVEQDVDGRPRRDGVARVIRRLLEARGAMLEADLIQATADLAGPHLAASPGLRDRVRGVLEVLVQAGEIARAPGPAGGLCWGLPLRYVNLGGGRAVAIGTAELTSDATPIGDGIVRSVTARLDAPGLSVCLGAPSYRGAMAVFGLPLDGDCSLLEFQAAALAAARASTDAPDPSARLLEGDLPSGSSLRATDDRVMLVAATDGGPRALPLPDRDAAQWFSLAARLGEGQGALHDGPLGLPTQIRTAAALGGSPDDDTLTTWTLPADLQQALRTWLGEPPAAPETHEVTETDSEQEAIIAAPPEARLIVEAGPGSGKTRVAIERVRSLIAADVSPTRIWLVSFTHAATGELRNRIAANLDDPRSAIELTISTLDSLAARLRRYGSSEILANGDYEASIAEAVRLVEIGDPQLTGFLRRLEHVIVDEVQDLTAQRSALLAAILRHLRPSCGVTLFQDSAQAIYGFADVGEAPPRPVAVLLQEDPTLGFSVRGLHHDHRTRDPALRDLKRRLRQTLLDPSLTAEAKYVGVRADIERSTPAARGAIEERLPSTSSMILFRSRVALVSAAARYWERGRAFRLRLPRSEPVLAPWIGAVLGGSQTDELSRTDFEHLWEETWPSPVLLTPERAWQILRSFQGSGAGPLLDLAGIARELAAGRGPPPAATLPILGRTGALLSTVHAVKGLETEHVVMVLPRAPEGATGEHLAEEARILFVAATRPKATLDVAGGADLYARSLRDGRRWVRRPEGHALVELGLEGDVESDGPGSDTEAAEARRARLWSAAEKVAPLTAVRTDSGYELLGAGAAERGKSFGFLSADVVADLRAVGRALHPDGARPGRTIRGLHLAGVRSTFAFDPEGPPGGRARFDLAPIVVGLPVIYFNAFEHSEAPSPGTP